MKSTLSSRRACADRVRGTASPTASLLAGASPEWRAIARDYLRLPDDEALSVYLGDDFRRVHAAMPARSAPIPTRNLTHADATYRTPFGVERYGYGYGMPLHEPLEGSPDVG